MLIMITQHGHHHVEERRNWDMNDLEKGKHGAPHHSEQYAWAIPEVRGSHPYCVIVARDKG